MPEIEMDDALSVDEVAVWLGLAPNTIRKYIKHKVLKAHKIKGVDGKGRVWRIWKQDVIDFVNSDTENENG